MSKTGPKGYNTSFKFTRALDPSDLPASLRKARGIKLRSMTFSTEEIDTLYQLCEAVAPHSDLTTRLRNKLPSDYTPTKIGT